MPSAIKSITIEPLTVPKDSQINFGAVVSNVDIENLTGKTSCHTSWAYSEDKPSISCA